MSAPLFARSLTHLSADDEKRGDVDTVAHGEMVEKELDAFIERRSRKGEVDPEEQEELWMESVRRFHDRRREENRWAWIRYFDRMATSHRKLSQDYQRRAEALCDEDRGEGA
jgi:hypothetical protein